MASLTCQCCWLLLLLILFPLCSGQRSLRPRALVLPVTKDGPTNQYLTTVKQRTPLVPVNLVVDLSNRFLWVDCEAGYKSSSYRPARCRSAECNRAGSVACGNCFSPARPGCNNNTCGHFPDNTITSTSTSGDLGTDVVALSSTNGSNPGREVIIKRLLFTCAPSFLLKGLARGVKGMAGLGRNPVGLPSLFAAAFSFPRVFALCLPSSTSSKGVLFFGNGPYIFLPGLEVSRSLIYTPLLINPVSTSGSSVSGESSVEYFVRVKSIKINGKAVPLNATLLDIKDGNGGTKISTVAPYMTLQTSIYNALVSAFFRETNLSRVAPVRPFSACFNSGNLSSTRVGPGVPSIDLILQNENVFWRIFGANSLVSVRRDVMCLAIVDGGSQPRTSIVIGAYQLEDNLLQFDLAMNRLGFSSSLLFRQTTCANFNFTSNAV